MSYTDLRDFYPEYVAQSDYYPNLWVALEKLGGGTVGESYDGTWRYIVVDSESRKEIMRGQDYNTGMPHTHDWVCADVLDYAVEKLGLV